MGRVDVVARDPHPGGRPGDPPYLCGLMERAALTGVLAANDVLAEVGVREEPVRGVPQRGLLAGWRVS